MFLKKLNAEICNDWRTDFLKISIRIRATFRVSDPEKRLESHVEDY